ncbi:hypothetical protein C8Q75DRAFT_714475 [Abortiporus biennis]|nr:hypothetical protein C8Q75DRAFT_714475 [Abortiporus biennis]
MSTTSLDAPSNTSLKSVNDSTISVDLLESEEEIFTWQEVPDKGKGLVATRSIHRGELLLAEPPLFSLEPSPSNSDILAALAECTREAQSEYFALPNEFKGCLLPALGIFETNALYYNVHDSQRGCTREVVGIFLHGSRFNSSCTPNVSLTWDSTLGVMTFRTLRNIEEGAELCFNYTDVLATKEQRQQCILEDRNFICRCSTCELEGVELAESDRRRSTIARLFDEVPNCGNEPTLGIRKIRLALRLLKEERLVHYEASFCYDAFQFCVSVSDFINAKAWIRRAWEVSCCTSGPDSNAARTFKTYWANPRGHHLAGGLPKATLSGPDSR